MSFEQFYVRSRDGTAIHCYSHGQGMPLVLVHGLQRCADIWFPLIGRLPGCFKLVMPNLRGRSGSGRPVGEDSYLLERFVDDLEAVVNSSGPAVMLLGWSMGASVAWGLANRSVATRVSRWIFVSGSPDPEHTRRLFPNGSESDLRLALARRVPSDSVVDVCSVDIAIAAWRGFMNADFLSSPPELTTPSLFIHGDQDKDCPVEAAMGLAKKMQSEVAVFEGAGHSPMRDDPERFVDVVSGFLQEGA